MQAPRCAARPRPVAPLRRRSQGPQRASRQGRSVVSFDSSRAKTPPLVMPASSRFPYPLPTVPEMYPPGGSFKSHRPGQGTNTPPGPPVTARRAPLTERILPASAARAAPWPSRRVNESATPRAKGRGKTAIFMGLGSDRRWSRKVPERAEMPKMQLDCAIYSTSDKIYMNRA